jgi:hypothetical protein
MFFFAGLDEVEAEGALPAGFGVRPEEWEDGCYLSLETLKTGKKRKELVSLPDHVWRPRAEKWARAFHCMRRMMYIINEAEGI